MCTCALVLCMWVHMHLYYTYVYICTCIVHMRTGALVHMCMIKWCLSGCSAILYISRTGRAAKQRDVATSSWRNILPLVYSVWQRETIEWDYLLCVHRIQYDILRTIIFFFLAISSVITTSPFNYSPDLASTTSEFPQSKNSCWKGVYFRSLTRPRRTE